MALSGTSAGFPSMDPTATAQETALIPVNASEQDSSKHDDIVKHIIFFLIIILAMVGFARNAVVLWLLSFRIKRNAFSTYILNLARADFLFLCCLILYFLGLFIVYHYDRIIFILTFFSFVSIFAYITGLSLLSVISTERCLSVLWPIWYRCHRLRHTSAVMCALIWALSLLLSVLRETNCVPLGGHISYNWWRVFNFIVTEWLLFLFVLLSGSSLALLTRLCGSQWVPLTRLYVTVLLTVLVFLLCGLPWGTFFFLLYWIKNYTSAPSYLHLLPLVLSCVNSYANPIIYFFVGSYRQHLRWRRQTSSWFCRGLCRTLRIRVNMEEARLRKPCRCRHAVCCPDSDSCFVQTHVTVRANFIPVS